MTRIGRPYGRWEPAGVAEVVSLFSGAGVWWWVAGGYAIELAVGRPLRDHADIDVLLLRPDQRVVQEVLAGWEWWAADPPGTLRPWDRGEVLSEPVHDIWCRPGPGEPWRIQVMLDEVEGQEWVSRWDRRVRRPLTEMGAVTADGVPYLTPEVQLLYKAKSRRPKDEVDFTAVLPLLNSRQREWLDDALGCCHGDHPWRDRLRAS